VSSQGTFCLSLSSHPERSDLRFDRVTMDPTPMIPPIAEISAIHHTWHCVLSMWKRMEGVFPVTSIVAVTLLQSDADFVTVIVGFNVAEGLHSPLPKVMAVNPY